VLGGFGGARDQMTQGWAQAGLPIDTAATPGASYDELRAKLAKATP
jgi:hypothetical protein